MQDVSFRCYTFSTAVPTLDCAFFPPRGIVPGGHDTRGEGDQAAAGEGHDLHVFSRRQQHVSTFLSLRVFFFAAPPGQPVGCRVCRLSFVACLFFWACPVFVLPHLAVVALSPAPVHTI